jgi:tetratricopeptide (TPR) repeat protein
VERLSHLSTTAGAVALLAGDAVAAERLLRPACERLEEVGELGYLSSTAPPLLDALYRQGKDDEALRLSDRWHPDRLTVPEDVDAQVGWRVVRAKLLARRGALAEAERLAREAVELAEATEYVELTADAYAALGDVLRDAGRHGDAEHALRESLRLHEAKGNLVAAAQIRSRLGKRPAGV